jgi:tetratricopeptide (TPR) repeat protein
MRVEEIVETIRLGLSGNHMMDMIYLKEKSKEYANHEFYYEISKEIGQLTLQVLNNKEDRTEGELEEINNTINSLYEEAQKLVVDKKLIEAKAKIEKIIDILPFKSEGGNTYFSFGSALEVFLFTLVFQPNGPIKQTKTDNSAIYHLYGYINAQLYRIPEAIKALEDSMRWDPVNVNSLIELAEISRLQSENEKFLNAIKNALALALSSSEIANCYYKLALYYKGLADYQTAICLYYVSNSFHESEVVISELTRMKFELNVDTNPPSLDRTKQIFEENQIQMGASEYAINSTIALADEAKKNNSFEIYKFCKNVYKDLTGNELAI